MVSGPPGLSEARNDWSGDVVRVRQLQTLQLIVVALIGIGVIVGGLVLGRRILDSQQSVARDQVQARELHRLRGELASTYARFLENRAEGRPGIDSATKLAFTQGVIDVTTLRQRNSQDAEIAAATERMVTAIGELGTILQGDYSAFPIGSSRDRAVQRRATAVIGRIDAAAVDWADRSSLLADRTGAKLQSLTRKLIGLLTAIVSLGGLAGILIAAGLARVRTRIVNALFVEHAARGAVIASVQDGLAVIGPDQRIIDMNDRLVDVTGFSADELRAARGSVPYLAGSELHPDSVGEHDLLLHRPDGTTVPVILSASPLTVPGGDVTGYVHVLKDVTERKRAENELRTLAMEQAALRRAATAVASGADPEDVFSIVAREVALLLGASGGIVSRFDRTTDRAIRVGSWVDPTAGDALPARLPLVNNVIAIVYSNGIPARTEDANRPASDIFARSGFPVSISAPVKVGSGVWGAVTAVAATVDALPPGSEVRLARFAELVGITVANADARAGLARLAATDALTGLANHRTFHERLRNDFATATSQRTPLSLVLFDLDHFKAVNDAFGHQAGDSVLESFGRTLSAGARYEELVARIGGEEFAWIVPGSTGEDAQRAAERVCATFSDIDHPSVGRLTVSAGVCDLSEAADVEALLRHADSALYWSKSHGRNTVTLFTPDEVEELSSPQRTERLTRSQAKTALRTLTRLIDAKDPATARHTERVASLAADIAAELGWPTDRVAMIEEAAMFHDIGKIVIPNELLFKVDALTPEERIRLESHVALGVELVDDVLQPEQIAWVRGHHERWDGQGYPDALRGPQIPVGAQIIHVADAWDAMTSGRLYQPGRSVEDAAGECRKLAGRQFAPGMVDTLLSVVARRERAGGAATSASEG